MESKAILGTRLDIINYDSVLEKFNEFLTSNFGLKIISPLNLECIMKARANNELKRFLNEKSNLNTIDGVGIINALKLYNIKFGRRVCGSDLVLELAKLCSEKNKKYFILGSAENISQQAKMNLKEKYPELEIENYSPPYSKELTFYEDENAKIRNILRAYKPDVLCVAFGAPKQELWIDKNLDFLNSIDVKIAISVGGTFDFVAGKVKRAPSLFQNNGMEWLYRCYKEPHRFKRQITTIPLYYILVLKEFLTRR